MTDIYATPHPVSDVMLAFPASLGSLLPPRSMIPDDYADRAFWRDWADEWFFRGLKSFPAAREGIDQKQAGRHLQVLQGSFEPKHEQKHDAVAWLASRWLVRPTEEV